ncbi:MAG: hypothetical protein ACO23R_18625, partial [bacterium]
RDSTTGIDFLTVSFSTLSGLLQGPPSVLRNFANIYIPGCSESPSRPFFDLARQFVWIMHLCAL